MLVDPMLTSLAMARRVVDYTKCHVWLGFVVGEKDGLEPSGRQHKPT